jgi:FG-GAP repeat/Dockerin type I domain
MKTALVLIIVFALGFLITPVSEISAQCPATYTYEGEAIYDRYGDATAIIGDYNNDGFDDFAIGSSENDESHTRAGKVYIYSGYDGSLMFTILGEESFDLFGSSISGGEDVDGDGFDDMLIGAHWWGPNQEGRAYIFLGESSPSNADASAANIIIQGTANDAEFGESVCMTSDHILVGAPKSDAETGKAFIFQHSDLTPGIYFDTDAYAIFTGEAAGDYFGIGLAGIKRVSTSPDFIFIGAIYNDDGGNNAGKVYEITSYSLTPGLHSANTIGYTFTGEAAGGRFGQSIAGAGFLDDDTGEDIIIGAPTYSRAYIFYFAAPSNPAENAHIILNGTGGSDWFGLSVSSAGDFNFDGSGDVVVGAQSGNSHTGKMYVFSGSDGQELFSAEGEANDNYFGRSVSGGDITGDGLGDVVVGASHYNGTAGIQSGKAYVYQGLSEARFCNLIAENAGDQYGCSVAGGMDANNDGYDDLVIGAMWHDGTYQNTGKVYLISGQTGDTIFTFGSDAANNRLGVSVDFAGDVNNDDYADVVVGAPGYFLSRGYVNLYSGIDGTLIENFFGVDAQNHFGESVSGAGDVNKDGYDDIIVGASGYLNNIGQANIYSGFNSDLLHSFMGGAEGDYFGGSVSGAGDVNNDGYADVIVGAIGYLNYTGRAYIYSGYDYSELYFFDGPQEFSMWNGSVSDAGDVNNDGYDDVIVGFPGYNSMTGRAYVYSGSDGAELYQFTGEAGDQYGYCVSSAEDVDDDCHDDLIVSAKSGKVHVYSGNSGNQIYGMYGTEYFGGSVSEAGDVNNDGHTAVIVGNGEEDRAYVYVLGTTDVCADYVCGDANTDLTVNVSDAVWIINYVFVGGDPPDPLDSGDANCDGTSNVSDAVWIINYVFVGGNEPCDTDGDTVPDC